jgi:hypothetical protein
MFRFERDPEIKLDTDVDVGESLWHSIPIGFSDGIEQLVLLGIVQVWSLTIRGLAICLFRKVFEMRLNAPFIHAANWRHDRVRDTGRSVGLTMPQMW